MNPPPEKLLEWRNVQAFPVAHGRLGFTLEVRRLMLETRFDALAVELPPSLEPAIREALSLLPQISLVTYRNHPEFVRSDQVNLYYVPVDPADPVMESLRIALGERTPVHFIDADVNEFAALTIMLPDAFALKSIGIEAYYRLALPYLRQHAPLVQDPIREKHMAARLRALSDQLGPKRRILFLCGLAHWENIRKALDQHDGQICDEMGPDPSLISVRPAHMGALPYVVSEFPHTIWHYERHRRRLTTEAYDPTEGLKVLLLNARIDYEREFQGSFEKATTRALETLLRYARKLTVQSGRLFPDAYQLILAAKSVVGNDYALCVLHRIAEYPPNGRPTEPPIQIVDGSVLSEAGPEHARSRVPKEPVYWRSLTLKSRPKHRKSEAWRNRWNPMEHCSWPPEDVQIENFRAYIGHRAKSIAGLAQHKTEPFTTSMKDGIDLRETMRNWGRGQIHVREEPVAPGKIGSVITIFEEDDFGTRFPWRVTWMAEHPGESTLAFYSTEPTSDMIGPGIGRIFYGGCLFLFPPIPIPCVWDDPEFERARTPSERLILAGLYWGRERFTVVVAKNPPSREIKQQAAALKKHLIFIPLSTFSGSTVERLRRAHVLNGQHVRAWADGYIR